ncbi:MAG: hydantoinase B/oxoprolinase family protein, partial [Longimicrobiales bacterium]|nr:hydantoinase B/oxoprolinase family protein [Longimicrobiales bacterium]
MKINFPHPLSQPPPHPSPSGPERDPVRLEVFRHLFSALTEEMGAALRRAAFSPNIKERRDYSCALLDADLDPVALGDHMPVHLGALPASARAARDTFDTLLPGDVVMVNDPFLGGTHLPDITLVAPIHADGDADPVAWLAVRAHHSDVGGMNPGSMPLAREIVQEGLRIPPVRLVRGGVRDEDLWRLVLANVRTPDEREGDLDAQLGALHAGKVRFGEIVARRGLDDTRSAMRGLIEYADRLLAAAIEKIPDGRWDAEDVVEDDGFGHLDLPVRVVIEVEGSRMRVDFRDSADQTEGGVNAVRAITESATRYVLRCLAEALLDTAIPAGGGSLRRVELLTRPGSIVDALPPASVAAGNVETSQRITDVLLLALQRALPEVIPASSQGTMNNLTVGGIDARTGRPFTYYETMGGGLGGGPARAGLSGAHAHMSNSLNTPVEALEHAYPFRVERYALRSGSGGRGAHPGGEGLIREVRLLSDARVGLLTERRRTAPPGVAGGEAG